MKINPMVFRNYDIRGIVGEDLDDAKVEAIGKAYGTYLHRRKIRQAVVGRDCRISGPSFQKSFISGLTATGVDVINLGMVMTQMTYYSQYYYQTNGGAMITASHNPSNFNGFKLAIGFSQTTEPEDVEEIKSYVDSDNYFISDKPGTVIDADTEALKRAYAHDVLKRVRLKKRFKVVIDTHHGTTGNFIPDIIKEAGCDVVTYNQEVDGNFPSGTPDPTDAHIMENLAELVLENKADVGFAFDGDGDRIGLVDEKGHVLWNDVAVAIFAEEILTRFPKSKIIYNTLCSQIVREVVKLNGGQPIIWRTGHSFIKAKIANERAAFGGELSGHFFFADNAYGHDDGTYAALRILEYLSEKNVTLSQLYESFPKFISSPEIKIGCPDNVKIRVIKDLSNKFKGDFPDAQVTDDTVIPGDDGVRADFEDGAMVFRYSQNGPYITVKFEAKNNEVFEERRSYVRTMLESYPEMIWKDQLCVNLDFIKPGAQASQG